MGAQISQIFPPSPTVTESSLPSLQGRVSIVTGASAGVGRELARLLYSRHATVYMAAGSAEKCHSAISWMKSRHPELDALFNNAGVMVPPSGSVTKLGYDLQLGSNCLAPFLFTKLLTPVLVETAKGAAKGAVRSRVGVDLQNLGYVADASVGVETRNGVSKCGNVLHALEYAERYKGKGIVSVALNPGNLESELQRHMNPVLKFLLGFMLYPPVNGAYTELFAGLSPEVATAKKGTWVVHFGRIMPLRKDLADGGHGKEFWEWSEKQVERYA
ncbi:short-chain dehydrogenase [Ampelomyces quisqualis]|uniref:Short-chain dehydrogenase n=1 Tax=Ampelomyces quisqualis TaxID=50730 RepID=A0A6A5QUZ6_AMPQU|nr:short-chain dehydrogenase [Ampelomyces quisqualis]